MSEIDDVHICEMPVWNRVNVLPHLVAKRLCKDNWSVYKKTPTNTLVKNQSDFAE